MFGSWDRESASDTGKQEIVFSKIVIGSRNGRLWKNCSS